MASDKVTGLSLSYFYRHRETYYESTSDEVFKEAFEVECSEHVDVSGGHDETEVTSSLGEINSDIEMTDASTTCEPDEISYVSDSSDLNKVFEVYMSSHDNSGNVDDLSDVFQLDNEFEGYNGFLDDGDFWDDVVEELHDDPEVHVEETDQSNSGGTSQFSSPLHPGSDISLGAALTVVIAFVQKFKLPGVALSSLILLINILLPKNHIFPKSLFILKKMLGSLSPNVKTHYFCKECLMKLDKNSTVCPNSTCAQSKKSSKPLSKSYFMEFDIKAQIKSIFSRAGMLEKLLHRFNRNSSSPSDIYDFSLYKSFSSFLNNPLNISFMWNTDGVPLFKSIKSSIWPVFYTINELPYEDRRKKENILISGLWYGETHPNMLLFLPPQFETLREFSYFGIKINKDVTIKSMLLCGTFDMPAKASVLNFQQFNSFYGCPKCLQEGKTEKTNKNGNVRCFPFDKANPSGPPRTHSKTKEYAIEAINSSEAHVKGVKGPSPLMLVPDYDVIRGMGIDYMHAVLLGVTKLLMSFWFDGSHKGESYSVFQALPTIENRLVSLKPPNHISRVPRTIKGNLGYWKASEFRSFLLYYFVPVMLNLLPSIYFEHFYLLSHAVHLLLKSKINLDDINTARRFLFLFCASFDKLYTRRYMTINIHSLVHLPQTVLELGPLYVYSLFSFEDKNGYILKLIHGTQNIPFQLASAVSASNNLPYLAEICIKPNTKEHKYLKQLNGTYHKHIFRITQTLTGIGSLSPYYVTREEDQLFTSRFMVMHSSVSTFPSIKLGGFIIRSGCRTKEVRRNSISVSLTTGHYFSIQRFACFKTDDGDSYYIAFGHYFNVEPVQIFAPSSSFLKCLKFDENKCLVKKVKLDNKLSIIEIKDIFEQCISLEVDGGNAYITEFPNILESD
ncbi:uncharacterized protein [Clytia hemisphaerica]|uniref:uncharacterized protein n=1 Tax=Clytia hemisphaerica TaxID=252671 RepID=UPI0034D69632